MSSGPLFGFDRRGLFRAGAGATLALGLGARPAAGTSRLTRPATAAAVDTSYIIDCAGWSARPPSEPVVTSAGTTTKLIVHQTEWPNTTDYSLDRAKALAREIQNLHMDGNGWIDTGQHFTVSRGGYVLEGRHQSLAALGDGGHQIVSAHAKGENTRAIGIENEGTYFTETPPAALWASLVRLCVTVCQQYGLGAHRVFGHQDLNNTDCPGYAFYREFPQLRRDIRQALGQDPATIPARTWPDPYSSSAGPVVGTMQYLLLAAGYRVKASEAYDKATTKALASFQQVHGLAVSPDGTVTGPTWEALCPPLGPDATGNAVRAAQSILAAKGYGLAVDGVYGAATISTVGAMQELHGLPVTGALDPASWCATVGGIVVEEFAAA